MFCFLLASPLFPLHLEQYTIALLHWQVSSSQAFCDGDASQPAYCRTESTLNKTPKEAVCHTRKPKFFGFFVESLAIPTPGEHYSTLVPKTA